MINLFRFSLFLFLFSILTPMAFSAVEDEEDEKISFRVQEPFLFRVDGKHLIFGTNHELPPTALPLRIRKMLAECSDLYMETSIHNRDAFTISSYSVEFLERKLSEFDSVAPLTTPWPEDVTLDFDALGCNFLNQVFSKTGRTYREYNPRTIYMLLLSYEQSLKANGMEEFGCADYEIGGFDHAIRCYFEKALGKEVKGIDTVYDRFLFSVMGAPIQVAASQKFNSLLQEDDAGIFSAIAAQVIKLSEFKRVWLEILPNVYSAPPGISKEEFEARLASNFIEEDGPVEIPASKYDQLYELYLRGDVNSLRDYFRKNPFSQSDREFDSHRNRNMGRRIVEILDSQQDGNILFCVGAWHLCDSQGIFNLWPIKYKLEKYNREEDCFETYCDFLGVGGALKCKVQ